MTKSNPVSFRLSDEAQRILAEAESRLGLKRSAVVELALRAFKAAHLRDPKKPRKNRQSEA